MQRAALAAALLLAASAALAAPARELAGMPGHMCVAYYGGKKYWCSLGKAGVASSKREGDGATPVGTFPLRGAYYRSERFAPGELRTGLRAQPIRPGDAWCEDPASPDYNRLVRAPHPCANGRGMWRDDVNVFDLMIFVGYNDQPAVPGYGSAIFLHLALRDYEPTAGCISFSRQDLLEIAGRLTPSTKVTVTPERAVIFSD